MILTVQFFISIATYLISRYITSDTYQAIFYLFLYIGISKIFTLFDFQKAKTVFNIICLTIVFSFCALYFTDIIIFLEGSPGPQYTGTIIENFKASSEPIAQLKTDGDTLQLFRNNKETILALKKNNNSYFWARSFVFNGNSCLQTNPIFGKTESLIFRKVIYIRSTECMGRNGIYLWKGNYFHSIILLYFQNENWQ
ncbi:hypothetical protein CH372_17280 [Leptospira meyeri]|uniref:hypothetical protein n=1 Tax=Leptospira meyeri TaxID=29508 RepID=UPI000C2B26B8|nr:hypothetical protein [Leptospira meyeri]PKA10835.1 hypothetical protein CH372_17280 [Leptospira meyeri]PKA23955.1 hypothetical protein CH381_23140 [Leptospira sp. mixed culture ATI2-C-A1]